MNLSKNVVVAFASLVVVVLTGWFASAKPPADGLFFTGGFVGDAIGTVPNMDAYTSRRADLIEQITAPGTLYFPFNGVLGDGNGDIGDVLLELNKVDSDGDGIGDLFNAATAIVDGTVCISGNVRLFVREDLDALGRPSNALFSIAWKGTEEKRASDYTMIVGGTDADPKNWWICPDRQSWPYNSRLLFGVDPLAGSNNCGVPVVVGQVFRVTRAGKKGLDTIWVYGQGGATAYVDILTTPEQ